MDKRALIFLGLMFGLAACALSPGQLDPIKVEATQSCVAVVLLGNPLAGASSATATIPISALPKLGIIASDGGGAVPIYEVRINCRS